MTFHAVAVLPFAMAPSTLAPLIPAGEIEVDDSASPASLTPPLAAVLAQPGCAHPGRHGCR